MKMTYDAANGGLSVLFAELAIVSSTEVKPGIVLDLDGEGRLVGVTLRNAKDVLPRGVDPMVIAEAQAETDDIAAAAAHGSTA